MGGELTEYAVESLLRDGTLIINDGYRAKNSELTKTGLPFARAGNINNGFHFEGSDCIPVQTAKNLGVKISQPGDVVFTSKGTVGRFAFVGNGIPEFVYSPQLCFWRSCDTSRIDPRWLYYWMNSNNFLEQYQRVAGQTDMAAYVNLRDQRSMRISIPPIEEQKEIAGILGSLDDKIDLNRAITSTLETIAGTLFQSWFVKFDPVRAKMEGRKPQGIDEETAALFPAGFDEIDSGQIPQGWSLLSLDSVADFLNGLALQKLPPEGGLSLPVIKIAQLRKGDSAGSDVCSADLPREYIVHDGDVLFSWSGSLEVELWCGGLGALNQHLFKVTSHQYPKWFYYMWTLHHLDNFRSIAAGKATTMGHIQRGHLTAAMVLAPKQELLDAMSVIIAPMIDQIITNRIQSRTLASVRDFILPKLLSSEMNVHKSC